MIFESKNIFENASQSGLNLFLGAGFSLYAKDINGSNLPLGNALCEELKKHFNVSGDYSLPQLSTILLNTKKVEFNKFLESRFFVKEFDDRYFKINDINLKAIFSTNIDNLVYEIFKSNNEKYLNDISINGPVLNDKTAVDYSALHGCILNKERPYIFDSTSLASTFSNSKYTWNHLVENVNKYPTLFWGYSLSDSGVLQALENVKNINGVTKEKWILLRSEDIQFSDYFRSLGFSIIQSNTTEFLNYIKGLHSPNKENTHNYYDIKKAFSSNIVPERPEGLIVRPIKNFFLGNPPIWTDIFSKQISQTSYYEKIKNKIYSTSNVIVIGTPASGKTTLLMQLAAFVEYPGIKLVFNNIERQNAKLLIKKLDGRKALIFMDNFSDSIEAFDFLSHYENTKVVGFERGHNFGIVSHLIDNSKYESINITSLTDKDIQQIFNSLPSSLRSEYIRKEKSTDYENDSLFEFISRNIKFPHIKERFQDVIEQIERHSIELAEFLILCCYVHYTRVPISFDMLSSYFYELEYSEIFRLRDELGEMVKDYTGEMMIDEDQDYYYPRSIFMAEAILNQCRPQLLKLVIEKALYNIPTFRICSYSIYRKKAYDKNIIGKSFLDWKEGKQFYEEVFVNDFNNPYVLQQGALYLSHKHRYTEAFNWIDRAITLTDNKYFSIRNSHAIILFDANINSRDENDYEKADSVRQQLNQSMEILEKCFFADKRKTFHALRYSEQALQYDDKYADQKSKEFLSKARKWLKDEFDSQKWNNELFRQIEKIEKRTVSSPKSI